MKKNALAALYEKDGTKKVLSSLISIVAGLLVGGIAVLIVGLCNEKISLSGAWDGIRIIFAGIFSTGRDAAGTLTWGFNAVNLGNMLFRATPLIMTGLSVAVAFKTGLFNIGAPGQYLISTMVTLMVALSIPSSAVPVGVIWVLAFLAGCLSGALWGRDSRPGEGPAEHQRGAGVHHDQLDRRQPGDLDVRHQQFQEYGREHQVRLYL